MLYLMYPMLLLNALAIVDCRPIDEDLAVQALDSEPSVDCYGAEHQKLLPLAAAAFVVYIVGIPTLLFGGLHRGAPAQFSTPIFKARYGFLFLRYERPYWWYELVVFFKRSLLVVILVMMSRYTIIQAGLMMMIIFFSVLFQDYARPYQSLTADYLDFGSLIVTNFMLLVGIVFHAVQLEQDSWIESDCREIIISLDSADNLSAIEDNGGDLDLAVECSEEQLSFQAAESTYEYCVLALKWLPVTYVLCALWGCYRELYRTLLAYQAELYDEADGGASDPKLGAVEKLAGDVLDPGVLAGAKDFLRDSTPTEREYFKHLLLLLDENYNDWLERQAKTFREFIETTFDSTMHNIRVLIGVFGAFVKILFCLRRKKAMHVDSSAPADGGAAAAVAMPVSRKKSIIRAVTRRLSVLFGAQEDEKKKAKPMAARRGGEGAARQQVEETGDDLVEAYIKYARDAKGESQRSTDNDEDDGPRGEHGGPRRRPGQLATPELKAVPRSLQRG